MKLYAPLILFLLIPIGSALSELDACNKTYHFVIENENSYTDLELELFSKEINISTVNITNHINNYKQLCFDLINATIPEEILNITLDYCDVLINRSILWGNYDMDTILPIKKIYRGDLDCVDVQTEKWLLGIEQHGERNYVVTGIKFWVIAIFIIMIPILIFIIAAERLKRKYHKSNIIPHLKGRGF